MTTTPPGQPGQDASDASAVGADVDEAGRLRAELIAVRAERDDLARRLAEALGEHRTAAGVGQLPLPGLTVDEGDRLDPASPPAGGPFVDVTAVELAGGYTLRLSWADGAETVADVEPYLWGEVGAPLRDLERFATVTVDLEAGTVVWPATGMDTSPVELRWVGRLVKHLAPPGLRTATRHQVLAARAQLLHLAHVHGLTDPGVDELGDLVVTLPTGEPGYRTLRAFAAAAAEDVGAWVNVLAADAPGAPTDLTPL